MKGCRKRGLPLCVERWRLAKGHEMDEKYSRLNLDAGKRDSYSLLTRTANICLPVNIIKGETTRWIRSRLYGVDMLHSRNIVDVDLLLQDDNQPFAIQFDCEDRGGKRQFTDHLMPLQLDTIHRHWQACLGVRYLQSPRRHCRFIADANERNEARLEQHFANGNGSVG